MQFAVEQKRKAIFFAILLAFVFSLAFGVSWVNVGDPFVRHDDFPAVFGEEELYYRKTLGEGRWLNYWWIARPILWSTQVNFTLYLLGWSIFAVGFAMHAFGANERSFLGARALLAALVVLTPQAFNIAQWFNTVVIGVWVLAGYSVICAFASRRFAIAALLLFSPLSFSAYSTYPFYLLAVLLCRFDGRRSWRDLFVVLSVFAIAFVMGMLMANTLNWLSHGVFGIRVEDWREPKNIQSFAELLANLPILSDFLGRLIANFGLGNPYIGLATFSFGLLSVLIVLRHDRMLALYLAAPAVLGMGLLCSYVLATGVVLPTRATVFLWLAMAFSLVAGVQSLWNSKPAWRIGQAGLFVLVLLLSSGFIRSYKEMQIWQRSTAELASLIPTSSGRIVIYGNPAPFPGVFNVRIQTVNAMALRLRYLTGKPAIMCEHIDADCSRETPPFDLTLRYGNTAIETSNGVTFIRLPALDLPP